MSIVSTLEAPTSRRQMTASQNDYTLTPSRRNAKAARQAAADQIKAERQASRASQFTAREAAEIEAKVLAWEAAIQKAHECYGEMNALEERMMELMAAAGVKSVRLADGRVVVVLDEFKDPCAATTVCADFIQVIPAGVIPE